MTGISGLPSSQAAALQNRALAAISSSSTRANATTSTTGNGSATPPVASSQLNANSFITLLTAQLQAQDPLDPMDPDQMMGELISLNSLQTLINIQQELAGPGGVPATGNAASNASANAVPDIGAAQASAQRAAQTAPEPSPSYHDVVVQKKLYPAQAPASPNSY